MDRFTKGLDPSVRGSMSTKTGVARSNRTQFVDAMKENGAVMTSSPEPTPSAQMTKRSALVPLFRGTACSTPT
jgi:hypothetical protein